MKLPSPIGCLFPLGRGNVNNKLHPEKFFPSCFRTGVRFPSAPPIKMSLEIQLSRDIFHILRTYSLKKFIFQGISNSSCSSFFTRFPCFFNLFWKRKCNEKCNGKSNIPQSSQGSFPNLNCTPFVDCRQTDLHHFNQPVRHRRFVCSVAKAFISAMASHTISSSTCRATVTAVWLCQ